MPPRKESSGEAAGPSPQATCLLDVMDAVPPVIGRLGREEKRAVRLLSRAARSAVEGVISALELFYGTGVGVLPAHYGAVLRFAARLPGLQQLAAPWDTGLLGQVVEARSGMGATVRRMELRLPNQPDQTLGPSDLGVVLAAFPRLEVRGPLGHVRGSGGAGVCVCAVCVSGLGGCRWMRAPLLPGLSLAINGPRNMHGRPQVGRGVRGVGLEVQAHHIIEKS
jgi:hypothetical protein